jgi:SM-20-related protein
MAEIKVILSGDDAAANLPVQDSSSASSPGSLRPRPELLLTENFLEAELCESLIQASRSAEYRQARFHQAPGDEKGILLDTSTRNVKEMIVFKETRALVAKRLISYKPALEAHFGLTLGECQRPNFLYYPVGGRYVAHTDSADDPEYPDYVRNRQVSVIIFLNSQADSDAAEGYRGGSLIIYTPNYKIGSDEPGVRVSGKAGSLVAFRSNVFHEVEPVRAGERFSVTSWFA